MSKNELTFEIRQLYVQSAYWNAYNSLLMKQDTILQQFVKATDLKYATGAVTLVEKTTIDTRLNEVRSKKSLVDAELNAIGRRLQYLMGVNFIVQCETGDYSPLTTIALSDTSKLKENPQALLLEQQILIAESERKLMNGSALPELKIGYFNQSLYGTPLSENSLQLAGKADRFQGFQFGLIIPLWFGPDFSRNQAATINQKVKGLDYENYLNNLQSEYEKTLINLKAKKDLIDYYEKSALPNAKLIEDQSTKSFELGEIEFTTHLLNLQQTVAIYESYLNAVNEYNANLLYLNYLMAE
jgi:cobalt-zinc-cadmium resistance protein CzcA